MRKIVMHGATVCVIGLSGVAALFYNIMILQDEVQPVLAMWLLAAAGSAMSFATYWSTVRQRLPPSLRILQNVGNVVDVVANTSVLATTLFAGWVLDHDIRFVFSNFEHGCIVAVAILFVFWRITKWHVLANVMVQVVMTVAYVPLIVYLWNAAETSEPVVLWGMIWLAALLAMVPAVMSGNKLAMLYNGRRLIVMSVVIVLILRLV